MTRTGISDAELARSIGVRRQTIFRWKEGLVARPRHREDVLRCAEKLRLAPEERDALLIAAGFPPESPPVPVSTPSPARPTPVLPETPGTPAHAYPGRAGRRLSPLAWIGAAVTVVALVILAVVAVRLARGSAYPAAGEGETLILVGRFVNYTGGQQGYNVAGRLQAALEQEVETARLSGMRVAIWPDVIPHEVAAERVGERSGAALVIWGEYDSGRVLARFTVRGAQIPPDERQLETLVTSPADLSPTINTALPQEVRYLALLTLGRLYLAQEEFERARVVLAQALVQPPEDSDALATLYFYLAYAYQVGRPVNLDEAIRLYTLTIAEQPGTLSAFHNRGIAYLHRGRAGDLDRAIEDLTRVIAARPEDAAAHTNRGVTYLERNRTGDLARALQDFTRAIELAPNAPKAYFNRALAYIQAGERNRWEEDLARVLQLDPDHAGAHNALCWGYALEGDPSQALPYCERAVALDPTGMSRDSRGIAYAQLGRLDEAIADFEAFLRWLQEQPPEMYARYGPRREAWLQALRAGRNPFDRETLEQLRQE